MRDVFGKGVHIKNGQAIYLRNTAARILMVAGWKFGAMASAMPAARTQSVREHAEELAALAEISKKPSDAVGK